MAMNIVELPWQVTDEEIVDIMTRWKRGMIEHRGRPVSERDLAIVWLARRVGELERRIRELEDRP